MGDSISTAQRRGRADDVTNVAIMQNARIGGGPETMATLDPSLPPHFPPISNKCVETD